MAVSLSKGAKISLAKAAAEVGVTNPITKVKVGLGWDINGYDGGSDFDLDASVFMCNDAGVVTNENNFIYYNNKVGQGIEHLGDNRTGAGEGDDEVIQIDLNAIPADVTKIEFVVTIHEAKQRNQNFGQVSNSFVHVMDEVSGSDLIRYDLGEDYSCETAIVVANLYRHNGEWKFNAVGSGWKDGDLASLCAHYGLQTA